VGTTKITVKVHRQMMNAFDRQVGTLNLKRDAFLNDMIRRETPNLAADLEVRANRPQLAGMSLPS
jgi:hypothetical protein